MAEKLNKMQCYANACAAIRDAVDNGVFGKVTIFIEAGNCTRAVTETSNRLNHIDVAEDNN